MFKRFVLSSFMLCCLSSSVFAAGGIAMGSTRVIYDGAKKEATITIKNRSEKDVFLIQSWVDDAEEKKVAKFLVTPPLFRLDPNREAVLRIVNNGAPLPQDRETVLWLNSKAIPPQSKDNNVLQIAIKTRMKLFYRPAGLTGSPIDSPAALVWKKSGNQIQVTNDTPYSVTFSEIIVAGKTVKNPTYVAAKSTVSYPAPSGISSGNEVTYKIINDFGGISLPLKKKLL
jgi:fimbrial chaperone protein